MNPCNPEFSNCLGREHRLAPIRCGEIRDHNTVMNHMRLRMNFFGINDRHVEAPEMFAAGMVDPRASFYGFRFLER